MNMDDKQFEEVTISEVEKNEDGSYGIKQSDGWHFYVPADPPIAPQPGMRARFYGRGIGFPVRGLFLDGVKVFYRTATEEEEKREVDLYGADAADWLQRWDAGKTVWSIEMGGLGPGYEQCIHITAAEILRHMLASNYMVELLDDASALKQVRKEIDAMADQNKTIQALGLSGAQWGAAMNLAVMFYRRGPRAAMNDDRVKDRHIQVQRTFPTA